MGKADLPTGAPFKFQETREGVLIEFEEALFDLGSSTLRPKGASLLDEVAAALRTYPGTVHVDASASPTPSDARGGDGLALAQRRAEEAFARLTRQGPEPSLDPRVVVAAGGESDEAQAGRVRILLRAQ
jgi:outer membrane protein OmpA-like peptidoglycan-associated protein